MAFLCAVAGLVPDPGSSSQILPIVRIPGFGDTVFEDHGPDLLGMGIQEDIGRSRIGHPIREIKLPGHAEGMATHAGHFGPYTIRMNIDACLQWAGRVWRRMASGAFHIATLYGSIPGVRNARKGVQARMAFRTSEARVRTVASGQG